MILPEKIKNLNYNKNIVNIPKYIYFNLNNYKKNKLKIIDEIKKKFKKKIIVRSASFSEDGKTSNAGKYLSIPNIKTLNNETGIAKSINDVFSKYKNKNQFVIIQEYIDQAETVGVIFTSDPKNNSPFRTINFNNTKYTDLITSGKSNGSIYYYFRNVNNYKLPPKIKKINTIINKIEKKNKNSFLDIEFLIFKKKIYVLQVRRINFKKYDLSINFKKSLFYLEKKIIKLTKENSHLLGKNRYFSTMTDWNPAEIIGLKPKPLALSLYKSLITDQTWAESRVALGYKDITKIPLMYSFFGTPYIDLKTDINSFLLTNFSDKISTKLLNFYFKEFRRSPYYYYDKIESDLVINCISLDKNKYIQILKKSKLTKDELNEVIKNYTKLTINLILKLNDDIMKYEEGENLFKEIKKAKNSTINKIFLLHNICKNYGTLPFANLARMAFVSIEFLKSLEKLNIITYDEKKHFLETIQSVSFDMYKELKKSKSKFLKKFGHLRPNTYDISTPNYKQNFENYFKNTKFKLTKVNKFNFTKNQKNKINYYLKKNKFKRINADILINFIESSIYQREKSKLFFTKIIDEIFTQLKKLFNRIKLKHSDIQYLDIKNILDLYEGFSHQNIISKIKKNIQENKKDYRHDKNFNLPNIILNKKDIYFYKETEAFPTFITNKETFGKFIVLNKLTNKLILDNYIICIKNADPGYDFIFNYKINGLVTAFGGPNSHMSIRCNEFSVPAAIGIGEKKFDQLIQKKKLYLNCEKKILSNI